MAAQRRALLCEAVGLSNGSDRDGVIDVDAAGVEGLAIEFEQGRILDLGLQDMHSRGRREAFGFFQQSTHNDYVGYLG